MSTTAFSADRETSTPRMVRVPQSEARIGASDEDKFANSSELPGQSVLCRGFEMGACPVTVGQWEEYASQTGAHLPTQAGNMEPSWPVTGVSFFDARGYVAWLSERTGALYRLPSEAEWELACRAGTQTVFSTGDFIELDEANYLYSESGERIGLGHPTPVGSYAPNAFGFYDLHGNVLELCGDVWHPSLLDLPRDGTARQAVGALSWVCVRGGSWDYPPRLLRSSYRDGVRADARLDNVGFRVVRELESLAS